MWWTKLRNRAQLLISAPSRTKSILHNPCEVLDPVYVCCVAQALAAIQLKLNDGASHGTFYFKEILTEDAGAWSLQFGLWLKIWAAQVGLWLQFL